MKNHYENLKKIKIAFILYRLFPLSVKIFWEIYYGFNDNKNVLNRLSNIFGSFMGVLKLYCLKMSWEPTYLGLNQ